MKVLPVVMRELSVSARRPFIYRARFVVGLLGFLAALLIFNIGSFPTQERGEILLITLGIIILVLGLLSGVFLTADCISEERREGTLGLLFLTDLRGQDVVLGKLVAQSATAFAATWSLLPILALPLMTGGVTLSLTLRVMLSLTLALLWSLAIGLAVSSVCQDSRKAALSTLTLMLILAAVPLVVGAFWAAVKARPEPPFLLAQFSPIWAFMASFRPSVPLSPYLYTNSVTTVAGECIVLLLFASWMTRSRWRQEEPKIVESVASSDVRLPTRRRRLPVFQEHLYAWLCQRHPIGLGIRLLFGLLSLCWFVSLIASVTSERLMEEYFITSVCTAALMHLIMKLEFALESTRQLHHDARNGGLELLLATPLSGTEIIRGQVHACQRRFFPALAFLTWINLSLQIVIIIFFEHLRMGGGAFFVFTTFFIGGIVVLYFDFSAIVRVGAWRALRSNTHLKAALTTLTGIIGIPWSVGVPTVAIAMDLPGSEEDWLVGIGIGWFMCSSVLSLLLGWRARHRLSSQFRQVAAR